MGIGSGVTHDSDPHDEWRECLLKGRFLTSPTPGFQLLETLLWQPGKGYFLLDEHLARLKRSAEYFYFVCDRQELQRRLRGEAESWRTVRRVRLVLEKDGECTITSSEIAPPAATSLPARPGPASADLPRVRFSSRRIDSAKPWCMHKTTNRALLDQEHARAREEGLLDVLFVNEKGEVTEGAITNLFIYRDGRYVTPPRTSGLLAGVMRGALIGESAQPVIEQVLYPEDVRRAEAVFVSNSVRGVVRVRLADG